MTPLVVAVRVEDSADLPVPKASRKAPCPRCGKDVWLRPESLKALAGGAELSCEPCLSPPEFLGMFLSITPEQWEQARKEKKEWDLAKN